MVLPNRHHYSPDSLGIGRPQQAKRSRNWQTFLRMQDFYESTMSNIRREIGAINALDFGTGRYGVGRSLIEPSLEKDEQIALYDPFAQISDPAHPDLAHIADEQEAFGEGPRQFNLVNLSYVLCLMEPSEARDVLNRLSSAHPNARFVVVDYVLRGREELVKQLDSAAENKWRQKMGDAEFNRTHCRFDESSLEELLSMNGFSAPSATLELDDLGIRKALLTEPESPITYQRHTHEHTTR